MKISDELRNDLVKFGKCRELDEKDLAEGGRYHASYVRLREKIREEVQEMVDAVLQSYTPALEITFEVSCGLGFISGKYTERLNLATFTARDPNIVEGLINALALELKQYGEQHGYCIRPAREIEYDETVNPREELKKLLAAC